MSIGIMYKALLFNPVLNGFTPSGTHEKLDEAIARIKNDLWRVRKDVPFYGVVVNVNNYDQVFWDSRKEQTNRDDPDPAYAEYQHIKVQWANRPEAN